MTKLELFNHLPIGMCTINSDYRIESYNTAFSSLAAPTEKRDITDTDISSLIDPAYLDGFLTFIDQTLSTHCLTTFENLKLKNTGNIPCWVNISVINISDSSITLCFTDISKEILYQTKANVMENRLCAFFDQSPFAYLTLNSQGLVTGANETWSGIFEYPAEEIAGKHISSIVAPEDRQYLEKIIQTLFSSGEVKSTEIQMLNKSGKITDVLLNARTDFDGAGKPSSIHLVMLDLSSQRHYEKELVSQRENLRKQLSEKITESNIYMEKAQAANLAKSVFISNMSHEIRSPLHAILNLSSLGKECTMNADDTGTLDAFKIEQYFHHINQSSLRLNQLLTNLLNLSQMDQGIIDNNFQNTNLLDLCQQTYQSLLGKLNDKKITLSIASEGGVYAEIDADRIQTALIHIIENSIKYSPAKTHIRLNIRHQSHTGNTSGESVVIQIIDQGIGIPESECESIFDQFVEGSHTRDISGGTGLGLSICQKIIHHHSGTIECKNNKDRGCTVTLTLPENQSLQESQHLRFAC